MQNTYIRRRRRRRRFGYQPGSGWIKGSEQGVCVFKGWSQPMGVIVLYFTFCSLRNKPVFMTTTDANKALPVSFCMLSKVKGYAGSTTRIERL